MYLYIQYSCVYFCVCVRESEYRGWCECGCECKSKNVGIRVKSSPQGVFSCLCCSLYGCLPVCLSDLKRKSKSKGKSKHESKSGRK